MPVTLDYRQDVGVLVGTVTDPFTLDDCVDAVRRVVQSTDWPPNVATIWDIREADLSAVDRVFAEAIFTETREQQELRAQARIAFVMSGRAEYLLMKMVELIPVQRKTSMVPFLDIDAAMAWVTERPG